MYLFFIFLKKNYKFFQDLGMCVLLQILLNFDQHLNFRNFFFFFFFLKKGRGILGVYIGLNRKFQRRVEIEKN
jgi:hypothetical protein